MNKPIISVLMTAYNRELYISEAIESVLASTFRDFELIIVDDGSKDDTVRIARKYEQEDNRIRVYENPVNLGDYHNRNKAAMYARGNYLKYVDSDDLIYPHGLEVIYKAMEQFPEAAMGFISNYSQEDKPYPFCLNPSEAYYMHFYEKSFFDSGPTGLVFRTEHFRSIGGFSGKRYVGDLEISLKIAAKWPVVKMASSLVFWRKHEGQEFVHGLNTTGYLELELPVLREALLSQQCPLEKRKAEVLITHFKKISARKILNLAIKKKDIPGAKRLYKYLDLAPKDIYAAIFQINKSYK